MGPAPTDGNGEVEMTESSHGDLVAFLQWALGAANAPEATVKTQVRFVNSRAVPILSPRLYHHAVDQREVRVLESFNRTDSQLVLATVRGRHVGSLGAVVPYGARFETFVHALALPTGIEIHGSLPRALLSDGVASLRIRTEPSSLVRPSVHELLNAEVEATKWSRAWALPSHLARLCLFLMDGWRPPAIADALCLSNQTVKTYVERLFARTRISSRTELPLAALRASALGCTIQ